MSNTLQKEILSSLKAHKGVYVFKTISSNVIGVPDIVFCYEGRFMAIEVKFGKDRLSEAQKSTISEIKSCGGIAASIHSWEQYSDFYLEYLQ